MRLYRPPIPVEVKLRVVLRQLGEFFIDDVVATSKKARCLGQTLDRELGHLAATLNCDVKELRLDHDPALALRERTGEGKRTVYCPGANNPSFMAYRPHGTQHAGSHDTKTRIRGDHGQFSDITLIKRERRRQRKADAQQNKPSKWQTGNGFAKTKQKIRSGKTKWSKRPMARKGK